ncbi:MAG: hypothetical protein QMD06_00015 [Candidatus Altarchaeum sp.]|nr:hypothetical protein [Candidatus Altarchaeum sp.]
MNLKFMLGSVQVLIFIVILIFFSFNADTLPCENCSYITNTTYNLSSANSDIAVAKRSSTESINAGGNFTFLIWVYNFDKSNATINIRDYLDECFIFLNQSMVFYNGTDENQFTSSFNNETLTWSNIFVPGKGNLSHIYYEIFLNVSTGDCHGNFTNFVNVNGTNSVSWPLGYLCEVCRENYTQKCENWNNYNNDDCLYPSSTSDCIESCEYEINESNYINARLRANKTVEIISSEHIDLFVSKSAPQNTTYGEIIHFNISWSVVHPSGNATNITITDDYLPSQISFENCSNNCVHSKGKVIWNFTNVANGSSGVVYLNVSVISLIGNILNNVEIKGTSGNKVANNHASSNTEILSRHISGMVFNDTNGNGINESGEGGISTTIYVNVTTKAGYSYDVIINSSLVDGNFDVIIPYGICNITASSIINMINTTPQTIYNIVVNTSEGSTGNNFGFYIPGGICPTVNLSCYPNANITILVDGINTTTFNYSGKPYNITVYARDASGNPIPNATIRIWEWNGHNPFALSQFGQFGNNVTNYAVGEVKTDFGGNARFTLVPTGGIERSENYIGPYNITLHLFVNCSSAPIFSKYFTVGNRALPMINYYISIPNKENVRSSKDYVYNLYTRIKNWLAEGGGENHSLVVYTNGTIDGLDFNVTSGKPTSLSVVVKYSNGSVVSNATLRVIEKNGHNPFALSQFGNDGSNLTNYAIAEVKTNENGNARFTIVPTGGIVGKESYIGSYSIKFNVFVNDFTECKDVLLDSDEEFNIPCKNRALPKASSPAYGIYNMENIRSSNDYIYNLYDRIKKWLS